MTKIVAIVPSNDLDASEAFYNRLGFTRPDGERSADPGKDHHRPLRDADGAELHLRQATAGWLAEVRNPLAIYLYTEDVDALAARFGGEMAGGGPEPKPWGMYEFTLSAPEGTLVRIGWPSGERAV